MIGKWTVRRSPDQLHKFQEAEQDVKRPEVKVPGGESAGTIILCCLFASISGDVLPLGWSCVQGGCDTGTNHVILQLFSHGHMIKRVYCSLEP